MTTDIEPIQETWYYHLDKGQRFFVVDVDADEGVVEIQFFDGDVEQFSLNNWYDMDIELSEAPENWTGPFDIAEADDVGTDITDTQPGDWSEPQQEFRESGREKLTREPTEPSDDLGEGIMEEESLER